MDTISVTALSFTEYVMSGQRGRISILGEQRAMYLAEDLRMCGFYNPVRDAMRRAVSSADPEGEMRAAVLSANRNGQLRAFEELADGFLPWLRKARVTGVPVSAARWSAGDLTLKVRPHLGLRMADGSLGAALVYVKEAPLTREAATVGLRILQQTMEETLPGGEPMVLDARRGKVFRLGKRTNIGKLDALIAAESAGYVMHWRLSA
ncbi:MAG: hypothetical protein ABIQ18_43070 [Umezawaea sp.]